MRFWRSLLARSGHSDHGVFDHLLSEPAANWLAFCSKVQPSIKYFYRDALLAPKFTNKIKLF
jgi:hypothetical protein